MLYTWGSGRGGALGFRSEEDIEDPTVVGDLQDMQVNGLNSTSTCEAIDIVLLGLIVQAQARQ